jgi:hypothetical protein
MKDLYFDLIDERWSYIAQLYDEFRDKKPIIEYLVDSEKIYSYPGDDYIKTLSAKTRNRTENQYEEACKKEQFLLFVRDEKNQKLKSYIFDIP